jgi:hypothetical protein
MQPICAVCNRIIWTPAREFVRGGEPDDWASMPARLCLDEGWRPKRVYVCAGAACRQAAREAGYTEVPATERNGYMTTRTTLERPALCTQAASPEPGEATQVIVSVTCQKTSLDN